jgi:hypothetical protein
MDLQFHRRAPEMTAQRGTLTFNFLQLLAAALLLVAVGCVLWEVWGDDDRFDCAAAHRASHAREKRHAD